VCDVRAAIGDLPVEDKARQLLEHYKKEAIRSLASLRHAHLKSLLHRITGRILSGV
jgi:hypothetical protein